MKRILFSWILLLMLPLNPLFAQESGGVIQQQLDDFFNLVFYDGFEVIYRQTPQQKQGTLEMTGPSELLQRVKVETKEGRLVLKISGSRSESDTVRVHLTSSALTEVRNNGKGTFTAEGPLTGTEIDMRITGNGTIRAMALETTIFRAKVMTGDGLFYLGGKTREAYLSVTGSGEIQAHELVSRDVKCSLTGNGNIGCHAEEKLKVMSTGSGVVYYLGHPTISKRAIGKGEIYPLKLSKD